MTEDRRIAEGLLDSLIANGLVLDRDREHAVTVLSSFGKVATMSYVEHYSLEDEKGELKFVCGTQFSKLERDMQFDDELRWHLLNALFSIRVLFQNQANSYIVEYLTEQPDYSGVFSGIGMDFSVGSDVNKMSLESLFHDYVYFFPETVREQIAAEYALGPEAFASYMQAFCFAYSLAERGRKLVDIRFFEKLPPLPIESGASLKWNYHRTMVGNIVLLYDHFVRMQEHEEDAWLEKEVRDPLHRYSIRPERIGFYDEPLDEWPVTIQE
ncbi:MAG: hypothetical protein KBS81_06305, partial [Spirochaetales bacterium]|nr:hypothetical protein [Candidatus Physcosoma equi]